ncbi:MAG: esterase [Pyrinomonadaceae bacterium]|nr:esterase [Pyrinomonadaceae bacterium]
MDQNKGTLKIINYESKVLAGNPLNDPVNRELCVYLPPGYEESGENFPVVYFLTGFTGRGRMLLNDAAFSPNLAQRLDALINGDKIGPIIGVMPDCFTKFGGSQYINSIGTGRYEDYLVDELVPFVDEEFRTEPTREMRALTGISSGGYGSMVLSMRRPEVFGAAASIAGDCLFEMCYKPDFGKAYRAIKGDPLALVDAFYDERVKKGKYAFDGFNAIGMSACYSPNPESDYGFDLPFDTETGLLRNDVWDRWLKHDPYFLADSCKDALDSLSLFYIEAGNTDEFNLDISAKALSAKLSKMNVNHTYTEFDGGHFDIKYRFEHSLSAISKSFGY